MSDIYKRIRARREELGLSQDELAKKMGYKTRSSINKIEMGENDIPQSKVVAFAKALDTTVAYLMGINPEPSQDEAAREIAIDAALAQRLNSLSPEEKAKVDAFVQGILASR